MRGGPVRRWVPKGLGGAPIYVFETGGSTGVPKSRIASEDFRIDYSLFSDTLPDEHDYIVDEIETLIPMAIEEPSAYEVVEPGADLNVADSRSLG